MPRSLSQRLRAHTQRSQKAKGNRGHKKRGFGSFFSKIQEEVSEMQDKIEDKINEEIDEHGENVLSSIENAVHDIHEHGEDALDKVEGAASHVARRGRRKVRRGKNRRQGHNDDSDSSDDIDDFLFGNDKDDSDSDSDSDSDEENGDEEMSESDEEVDQEGLPNFWEPVAGTAEKVIASATDVFAINSRNTLFALNEETEMWTAIPDSFPLLDVSVGDDGSAFGVGRSGEAYRRPNEGKRWRKIRCRGKLIEVASYDKKTAWAINRRGKPMHWTGATFKKVSRDKSGLKFTRLTVNQDSIYGITRAGKVYGFKQKEAEWYRAVKGKMQDIDLGDDGSLWCASTHGVIGKVSPTQLTMASIGKEIPSIQPIAGKYNTVTATSLEDLWAVDDNKNIFHWVVSEEGEEMMNKAEAEAAIAELALVKEELAKVKEELAVTSTSATAATATLSGQIQELESSKQSLIEELQSKNSVLKTQEEEIQQKSESLKIFESEATLAAAALATAAAAAAAGALAGAAVGAALASGGDDEESKEAEPVEKVDYQESGAEKGPMTVYEVMIQTGGLRGSGTDAKVYIKLFGEEGEESGELYLDNSPDNFSTGKKDQFTVRPAVEFSTITKILVGHDNTGFGPTWFVDCASVRNRTTQDLYKFKFGQWFATDLGDGLIGRESTPFVPEEVAEGEVERSLRTEVIDYKLTIVTGDISGAGTDAQIFVQLYGDNGDSMQTNIEGSFERGTTTIGGIRALDLGNLQNVRIGHNNAGWGPGWFCDKIIVRNESSGQQWYFLCGKWFDTDQDDGQIVRTIESCLEDGQTYAPFKTYEITVITGDRRGAGTDANVFISLYGDNGEHSGDRKLESKGDNFERNQTDEFGIECVDLGSLTKIRIGHDNRGWGAGWFLGKVIVTDAATSEKFYFLCGDWLSADGDGDIVKEIPASNEDGVACAPLVTYTVTVLTGDRRGAGTDAVVSLAIYGDKGDTGDRKLDAASGDFERADENKFTVEAVEIGVISKIRISHNNAGWGAAWFLEKVTIRNEATGEEYYFLCGKWLDSDGSDSVVKEIAAQNEDGIACGDLVTYQVDVITGDRRGAGTSANVHIILYGDQGDTGKRYLEPQGFGFSRNEKETFGVEAVDLGEISRIEIGHDNSSWLPGWFLDKVVITNKVSGEIQYFPSGQWFDSGDGDCQIVRELLPAEDGPTYKQLSSYSLVVTTGDRRGAGTNANVTATVYGEFGDSGLLILDSSANDFERGNEDKFQFECPNLGSIIKIRIGHDDSGWGAGWFLDKCTLVEDGKEGMTYFLCGKWLDKSEDDGEIQREIPASTEDGSTYLPIVHYKITVLTGDRRGAGTDAKVTCTVFGENGDSGPLILENASNNFERNCHDEFGFDAVELGSITNIRVGHDNSGFGAGWFLDKVIVNSQSLQRDYYFPIGRWLATDEEDGQIFVDKEASDEDSRASDPFVTYKVIVHTGDRRGAGTDATVFIELTGEEGKTSGRHTLESDQNNFERKKEDVFGVESVELGQLSKVTIGHDGSGFCSGWFLDKVVIQNMATNEKTFFLCGRWLATSEEDGLIVRELIARDADGESCAATKQYAVTVYTGDRDGAGTSATVSITLCGENGNTGPHPLDGDPFEKEGEAVFQVEAVDLGNLRKIRIGHDNSGIAAGWFLDKVKIEDITEVEEGAEESSTPKVWYSLCGRWLSESEDDGAISRELPVGSEDGESSLPILDYTVTVITGDRRGAGTNEKVELEAFGANGSSGVHHLENAADNFERNKRDVFQMSCVDLGDIQRIRIGHDGAGWGAGWFLDKVIIHSGDGDVLYFHCGRWLATDEDDNQLTRELFPSTEDADNYAKLINYRVTVTTGDRRGAGTDSRVFVQLYGEKGQSPESTLESSLNNFERNKTETFVLQTIDIGSLTKIRIGHDNSGWGSAWFLDKVEIESEGGEGAGKYYFLCGKWLATSSEDGLIIRELPAANEDGVSYQPLIDYKISILTGDRRGAGTNANVSLCITGENGDTGDLKMDNSTNNFERGQTDEFGISVVDLGAISKIRIGHDNSGFYAGWFLESVTITNTSTNESIFFFSGKWFDTDEDDGQVVREIAATDDTGKASLPEISYEITVFTGDRRGAGTNANVYIELFGEDGSSGKRKLEGQGDNFERNQIDKFHVVAVSLGDLTSINIGHDGSGFGAGWFLEKVTVRNPSSGQEYYFLNGRWLDAEEDDGKIIRQLTPSNEDGMASIPLVDYTISVTTGDRRGAGTDASVCIKIQGSDGKSGRQLLSPDDKNSFRRNQTSVFGIQVPDMGTLERIVIGHNDKGWGAAWFMDKVVIRNEQSGQEYFFLCGEWLDSSSGDCQVVRTIAAAMEDGTPSVPIVNYKVTVLTGDRLGAGTDANVCITLFGENGDSGSIHLDSSGNDFERNQSDVFGVPVPDLGSLTKIRIGHDDAGWNSGWFCDKIIVENTVDHQKWWFLSGQWFDKDSGDKAIVRDIVASTEDGTACLPLVTYSVTITTGSLRGSGTDANVYINITGANGDTGKQFLRGGPGSFERSGKDTFGIFAVDLGDISQIEIGHDGKGWFSGWYLERAKVRNEETGMEYHFQCGRWLDEKSGDGSICASLFPSPDSCISSTVAYQIIVETGDVRSAGCSANVFIILFGEDDKETSKLALQGDKDSFTRGKNDIFMVEAQNVGQLSRIRIGHDGAGGWSSMYGAAWYLANVTVKNMRTNDEGAYEYGDWVQKENLVVELFDM